MNILAIIVTYYPNADDLVTNVFSFINEVETLIIWDNTPLSDQLNNHFEVFKKNKKIIQAGTGKNMGLAFAFNYAIDFMREDSEKYTHLLTMDQDSTWINFKDFVDVAKVSSTNSIYSPNINHHLPQSLELSKVKTCINSGALFPVEVLNIIGKFNEVYSVDAVDYDFCFRANIKGISIIKVPWCHMNQKFGVRLKSKYFNLETNVYSPKRLFFIARNHILLWRDYPAQLDFQLKKMILISYTFGKMIKVTLMEDDKIKKNISILSGFFCGLMNNRTKKY